MAEKNKNKNKNTFTKECMVTALKRFLVSGRKLEDITVSELTKEAGVSRTTFYRNYSSIADIFEDYLERYPFGVGSAESYNPENFNLEGRLRDSLEFLKKEQDLLNSMINAGLDYLLYNNYEKLIKSICRERAFEIGFRSKYDLTAFSGIYFSLCYEWIKGGMKESIDDMVDICYRIIHRFYINDKYAHPRRDDVYKPSNAGLEYMEDIEGGDAKASNPDTKTKN